MKETMTYEQMTASAARLRSLIPDLEKQNSYKSAAAKFTDELARIDRKYYADTMFSVCHNGKTRIYFGPELFPWEDGKMVLGFRNDRSGIIDTMNKSAVLAAAMARELTGQIEAALLKERLDREKEMKIEETRRALSFAEERKLSKTL